MDIKSSDKTQLIFSYLLKASSLIVLVSTAIALAFSNDFKGLFALIYFFYIIAGAGWFIFPYALALTPSRKAQSYGAVFILLISLSILSSILFSLFSGGDLGWLYDDLLYTQLIVFNLIAGVIASIYLILSAGDRSSVAWKIITPIAVAVLLIVQALNTFPGAQAKDAFRGWDWEAIASVGISLAIGMVILFFSNVKVTTFLLLVTSAGAMIYQFMNMVHYLQWDNKTSESFQDFYSDVTEKPSPLIFLQFFVALACFGYSLYLINTNDDNSENSQIKSFLTPQP